MLTTFIVTVLVGAFVAIAVLGHVLVFTALVTKPDGAKRAAKPKDAAPAGRDLSTAKQ